MPAKMDHCSKAFETILCQSGKFGPYQKRLYSLTSLMHVVCTSVLMYRTFLPWQWVEEECVEVLQPISNLSFLYLTVNDSVIYHTTCREYFVNEIGLDETWVLPEWTFPEFEPNIKWMQLYSQAVGLVIGMLLGSILADSFGRRRIMFVSFGFMCFAQCGLGFVPDWKYFIGCLCLVGFGAGGFIVSSLALVLEYVGHDWRDICICFIPWWMGPVLLAIEAYVTQHWRYLAIVSGAIGLPLLGAYFLVLESARWLMCTHRFSAAEKTTREVVACNREAVEEITTLFDISRVCIQSSMHKKRYTFYHILHTCKLRKRTVSVIITWFLGAMVYSGFQCRVTKLIDNPYLDNLTKYGTDVIVIVTGISINKCIGRRWTLFLFSMSSGFISMCILVLHVTNERDIDESLIKALAFFTKLVVTTSLTLMNLVVMEIFPTVVRCMGCAVGFTAGIGGYLLAEKLNTFLEPFHYTVPFLVHGGMMCLFAIIVLVFPETMRRPLPDIMKCRHRNLCSHENIRLTSGWVT